MIYYDSNKDRSEEFGWKKVCDEGVPTEEEQDRWGKITLVCAVLFGAIGLIYGL
jgi:hypothetical protein